MEEKNEINIIDYLKKFIIMNPDEKGAVLSRWIDDTYPDFIYKESSLQRYIQRVKKGDPIKSKRIVDLDEFPLVDISKGNVTPQVENIEIEFEQVMIEEEEMKLEDAKTSYEYTDGIYIFGNSLKLSGELISDLFSDYPSKGLNLSRTALINKYNLGNYGVDGPTVLRTIQHTLGLYKDSNIIAPHLYDELSSVELDAYIDSQLDKVISNPEYIEKKYNNRVLANYRRVINEKSLQEIGFYNKLEEIAKQFSVVTKFIALPKKIAEEFKTCVVTIADMHSGANVKDVQRTHDFDTETIRKRLDKIAEVLNKGDYSHVNIAIIGDVFQGTPFNHVGAGNTIAEQYADQFKVAFELLVEFLGKVNNVTSIYAVGGEMIAPKLI